MKVQFYTLSQTSLKPPSMIIEEYIPLWFADGTSASVATGTVGSMLLDGSTSTGTTSSTQSKLYTLNANWSTALKFAFETTIWAGTAGNTVYATLWDLTSGSGITSVSTTSGTATVIRSSQLTLIPGHVYGVCIWSATSTITCYISDASLIVFGS